MALGLLEESYNSRRPDPSVSLVLWSGRKPGWRVGEGADTFLGVLGRGEERDGRYGTDLLKKLNPAYQPTPRCANEPALRLLS